MTTTDLDQLPPDDKLLFDSVNNLLVYHPRLVEAKRYADQLVRLGPFADEAPCSEISGPPGVGKTTLWKWIRAGESFGETTCVKLRKRPVVTVVKRPFLAITLEQQPTVEKICNAFLKELGDPWWDIGSTTEKTARIDLLLHCAGVVVVYIDEFQYVVDRTGVVIAETIVDWLRDRHTPAARLNSGLPDARSIALCLMGLGRLNAIFSDDFQRLRRWDAGWRITPYSDSGEDLENFAGILTSFANACALPINDSVDLGDPDLLSRFHYATWGIPGQVKKLFSAAMRVAGLFPEKHATVDLRLLERAFDLQMRVEEHRDVRNTGRVGVAPSEHPMQNPFSCKFDPSHAPPPLPNDTAKIHSSKLRRQAAQRRRAILAETERSFFSR